MLKVVEGHTAEVNPHSDDFTNGISHAPPPKPTMKGKYRIIIVVA
jgi:hypothetical protein